MAGSRGAALQTDKANGRQTDGGGKDGDAGGGSALVAHPQPVRRVHEPLLSPSPLLRAGPPPRSSGARPVAWAGLEGRGGSGEAGLKGASNHRRVRGASPPSSRPWDHAASPPLRSFFIQVSPSAPLSFPGPESHLRYCFYFFFTPPLSLATKPTSPNHSSTAGSPSP